jgi:hypothetical protein
MRDSYANLLAKAGTATFRQELRRTRGGCECRCRVRCAGRCLGKSYVSRLWDKPVPLKVGQNTLRLDQTNGTPVR